MKLQVSISSKEKLERVFLFHAGLTLTIESALSRDSGYTLIMLLVASIIFAFSFFPKSYKYISPIVGIGAAFIAAKGWGAVMMRGPTLFDHLLTEPNPNFGFPLSIYFGLSAFIHCFGPFAMFSDSGKAQLKVLKNRNIEGKE